MSYFNCCANIAFLKRLNDVSVRLCKLCSLKGMFIRKSSKKDERQLIVFLYLFCHLYAIQVAVLKVNVEKNQIRLQLLNRIKRLLSIWNRIECLIAKLLQNALNVFCDDDFVFND